MRTKRDALRHCNCSLTLPSRILVFASKQVGEELTGYLLNREDEVSRVIAGSSCDQKILQLAKKHAVPASVFDSDIEKSLVQRGERFEWLLNFWSPHLLSEKVLNLADYRVNVHPSLVPYCRGNDCAAWTIRTGAPAGVSLLEMTEDIDSGRVWAQRRVSYDWPIRGRELHDRLQEEAIQLFRETWPEILAGERLPERPAREGGSYFTRADTEEDRHRRADEALGSIGEVVNWVLAHDFYPGTTAVIERGGTRYRVRVRLEPLDEPQGECTGRGDG